MSIIDTTSMRIPHIVNPVAMSDTVYRGRRIVSDSEGIVSVVFHRDDQFHNEDKKRPGFCDQIYLGLRLIVSENRVTSFKKFYAFAERFQSISVDRLRMDEELRRSYVRELDIIAPKDRLKIPPQCQADAFQSIGKHDTRAFLDTLAEKDDFTEALSVPGMEILEARDRIRDSKFSSGSDLDCISFVFGSRQHMPFVDVYPWEVPNVNSKLIGYTPTKNPKNGDLALYFWGRRLSHAGIVHDENSVISKFNHSHVFLHSSLDVPTFWGEPTFFQVS